MITTLQVLWIQWKNCHVSYTSYDEIAGVPCTEDEHCDNVQCQTCDQMGFTRHYGCKYDTTTHALTGDYSWS